MLTQTKSKHLIKLNINLFGGEGGGVVYQKTSAKTVREIKDLLTMKTSTS